MQTSPTKVTHLHHLKGQTVTTNSECLPSFWLPALRPNLQFMKYIWQSGYVLALNAGEADSIHVDIEVQLEHQLLGILMAENNTLTQFQHSKNRFQKSIKDKIPCSAMVSHRLKKTFTHRGRLLQVESLSLQINCKTKLEILFIWFWNRVWRACDLCFCVVVFVWVVFECFFELTSWSMLRPELSLSFPLSLPIIWKMNSTSYFPCYIGPRQKKS